jgi:hypothetical protein
MKTKLIIVCMISLTCSILGHQKPNQGIFLKVDSLFNPLPVVTNKVAPQDLLDSVVNLHLDLQKEAIITQDKYEMLLSQQKILKTLDQ